MYGYLFCKYLFSKHLECFHEADGDTTFALLKVILLTFCLLAFLLRKYYPIVITIIFLVVFILSTYFSVSMTLVQWYLFK